MPKAAEEAGNLTTIETIGIIINTIENTKDVIEKTGHEGVIGVESPTKIGSHIEVNMTIGNHTMIGNLLIMS